MGLFGTALQTMIVLYQELVRDVSLKLAIDPQTVDFLLFFFFSFHSILIACISFLRSFSTRARARGPTLRISQYFLDGAGAAKESFLKFPALFGWNK